MEQISGECGLLIAKIKNRNWELNLPTKVPILKECHFGKMKLWQVEHFWTYLSSLLGVIAIVFSNHAQK